MPMPVAPIPVSRPRQYKNRSRNRQKLSSQVERFPNRAQSIPSSVRSLLFLQKTSSAIVFILIAATLGIYAWIFYSQQLWSKEYKKLESLQKDERQLTSTNEAIKNKAAQEAEKEEFGLVPLTPDKNIFVPATVVPPAAQKENATTEKEKFLEPSPLPLAY
jgi:hypothetical protein